MYPRMTITYRESYTNPEPISLPLINVPGSEIDAQDLPNTDSQPLGEYYSFVAPTELTTIAPEFNKVLPFFCIPRVRREGVEQPAVGSDIGNGRV